VLHRSILLQYVATGPEAREFRRRVLITIVNGRHQSSSIQSPLLSAGRCTVVRSDHLQSLEPASISSSFYASALKVARHHIGAKRQVLGSGDISRFFISRQVFSSILSLLCIARILITCRYHVPKSYRDNLRSRRSFERASCARLHIHLTSSLTCPIMQAPLEATPTGDPVGTFTATKIYYTTLSQTPWITITTETITWT